MTKEEYTEKLTKYYEENKLQEADSYGEGYTDGLAEALDYAIDLAEKLDEPKKVVIPEFVADWIQEAAQPSTLATIYVMHSDAIRYGKHIDWFKNHDNQRLLLKALLYGYEVEEPRRVVKLKGIHGLRKYVRLDDEGKVVLGLAGSDGITGGALTEEEAKEKWPEFENYNNAGLLEFEEVENE